MDFQMFTTDMNKT